MQGGRPVIKGTRLTVSAIFGRLSSDDSLDILAEDYRDIPREASEAAFILWQDAPASRAPEVALSTTAVSPRPHVMV